MFTKLRKFLKKLSFLQGLVLVAIIYFFFSGFLFYLFELGTNERVKTLFDAYWILLVYYFCGLDFVQTTLPGRILAFSVFLMGLLTIAAIIGKITSILIIKAGEKKRIVQNLKGHIVICNWNEKGEGIVKEIKSSPFGDEIDVVIISEFEVPEAKQTFIQKYDGVYFLNGNPEMHEVLNEARVCQAKSVIILADLAHPLPDEKTALIALAITRLGRDSKRKPNIVAEIVNHQKIQHLVDAGVDEYVCAADFAIGIITQSAIYQKFSNIYQQLLSYSRETNEIYVISGERYPQSLLGKTFPEISEILNSNRKGDNPVILLGVKRDKQVFLNPRESEFERLRQGDELIVMSFWAPDLSFLGDLT